MKEQMAFIGAGNMGGPIVRAVCRTLDPGSVVVYRPNRQAAEALAAETGCRLADSGAEAVRQAKYVMLCVKPQVLRPVLEDLIPALAENRAGGGAPVVVSIAAGVRLEAISAVLAAGGGT